MEKNVVEITMNNTEIMRAFEAIETKVNRILNILEQCEDKSAQNLETTSISALQ
jgi:hypothetical protein